MPSVSRHCLAAFTTVEFFALKAVKDGSSLPRSVTCGRTRRTWSSVVPDALHSATPALPRRDEGTPLLHITRQLLLLDFRHVGRECLGTYRQDGLRTLFARTEASLKRAIVSVSEGGGVSPLF